MARGLRYTGPEFHDHCVVACGEDRVRHGVPAELLCDRGATFLSKLMAEVYRLMGIRKVNTTAYNPQTAGLDDRPAMMFQPSTIVQPSYSYTSSTTTGSTGYTRCVPQRLTSSHSLQDCCGFWRLAFTLWQHAT